MPKKGQYSEMRKQFEVVDINGESNYSENSYYRSPQEIRDIRPLDIQHMPPDRVAEAVERVLKSYRV